jgi:anti-anti-sigma factor
LHPNQVAITSESLECSVIGVLRCARLTKQPASGFARVRSCSGGAGDIGKPGLPGGKHETLTDGPDEPRSSHQHSSHQASPGQASVRVTADRGLAIVTPLVQVDAANAQRFWEALVSVSQDYSIIVVDLTASPACDWHALSALIMALKYTDVAGGELRIAAGSPAVRRVLTDAGMDRLFAIFDSLADAMPHREPPLEPGLADCAPA